MEDANEVVTALEDDGEAMTDTPAFKAWFGDSKTTDANGVPLVFYHGTNASFTEFCESRIGEAQEGKLFAGRGFYFADNAEDAAGYGANVMAVYLKISNPLDLRNKDEFLKAFANFIPQGQVKTLGEINSEYALAKQTTVIEEVYLSEDRPGFFDVQWKINGDWHSNWPNRASSLELSDDPTGLKYATKRALPVSPADFLTTSAFSNSDISAAIRNNGFDGAINHGSIGHVGDEYVVISPTQIKLAQCRDQQRHDTQSTLPDGVTVVTEGVRIGKVVDITPDWIIQDSGRGTLVGYPRAMFDDLPIKDACIQVVYRHGKATIMDSLAQRTRTGSISCNQKGEGR